MPSKSLNAPSPTQLIEGEHPGPRPRIQVQANHIDELSGGAIPKPGAVSLHCDRF